jgi:hypothetical protein
MRFGAITTLLVLAACGSTKIGAGEGTWNADADKSFSVSVKFLKFRKTQMHLSLRFTNAYPETVKAIGQGVLLEYGGVKGKLSRDTTPDYPVAPGLSRTILFKYNFETAPEKGKVAKIRVPIQKEDGTVLPAAELSFTAN